MTKNEYDKMRGVEDPRTSSSYEKPMSSKKSGYGYDQNNIPCSKSILDDVSRLEVLIGGKRAGNNSPKLINEATEICQRLFQGHVMNIKQYREFVDEIIDSD